VSPTATSDSLTLLSRSVECCPDSEELWLTYAKFSDFKTAQSVLNNARKRIPTSVNIWIAAAELADSMGAETANIESIIRKAIASLELNGVVFEKRDWLNFAKASSSPRVPSILIHVVVKEWIEKSTLSPKDIKHEIFRDLDIHKDSKIICDAILKTAAMDTVLRERKGVWVKWIQARSGDKGDDLELIFSSAVNACSHSELLWLMFAKHRFAVQRDVSGAREILTRALSHIDDSEDVYLSACRVAIDADEARGILATAREKCESSIRIWIKSAQIERQSPDGLSKCIALVEGCLSRIFKNQNLFKLFLIAAHACFEHGNFDGATAWVNRGIDTCPTKAPVWIVAADLAISKREYSRARSILERGRIRLPTDESLWWKGYFVEKLASGDDLSASRIFLSRALQACPNSGLLWSHAIDNEPVISRHPKCLDALKKCENDPLVILAVARFFWIEKHQIDKARKWFLNAAAVGQRFGQVWADYLGFEVAQGVDANWYRIEALIREIDKLDLGTTNLGIEYNVYRKRIDNWVKEENLIKLIVGFSIERFPHLWVDDVVSRVRGAL